MFEDENGDQGSTEKEQLEEGDPPETEQKLGQSGVRHHEDGSVTVDGDMVDNPENDDANEQDDG